MEKLTYLYNSNKNSVELQLCQTPVLCGEFICKNHRYYYDVEKSKSINKEIKSQQKFKHTKYICIYMENLILELI